MVVASWLSQLPHLPPWFWVALFFVVVVGLSALQILRALVDIGLIKSDRRIDKLLVGAANGTQPRQAGNAVAHFSKRGWVAQLFEKLFTSTTTPENNRERSVQQRIRAEITKFEELPSDDPRFRTASDSQAPITKFLSVGIPAVALIELLVGDNATDRARNWRFTTRSADGVEHAATVDDAPNWSSPQHWGGNPEPFRSVDGVRLEKGALKRTYVFLRTKTRANMDMRWLSVAFEDDAGPQTITFEAENPS